MSTADATPSGSHDSPARASARVLGIVRGREVDAQAALELEDDALVLYWSNAQPWRLAFEGVDGVTLAPGRLTMYLASGDVLEFSGDDALRPLGTRLLDQACAMPELTRGLKAMGSRRGAADLPLATAHDAWFAPLLSARRAVEGVSDPLRQVTLLDASEIAAAMTRVMAELAAIREPTDAATQRAIEAVLEEASAPLFTALERMALAGDALRGSAPDTRLSDWRRWVECARAVFVAADESWGRCAGVLG